MALNSEGRRKMLEERNQLEQINEIREWALCPLFFNIPPWGPAWAHIFSAKSYKNINAQKTCLPKRPGPGWLFKIITIKKVFSGNFDKAIIVAGTYGL